MKKLNLLFSFKEMIIDRVNGQAVPRYLIYDIIKFNVSTFNIIYKIKIVPEITDMFLQIKSVTALEMVGKKNCDSSYSPDTLIIILHIPLSLDFVIYLKWVKKNSLTGKIRQNFIRWKLLVLVILYTKKGVHRFYYCHLKKKREADYGYWMYNFGAQICYSWVQAGNLKTKYKILL